jgi:5'-methylthioadenosine phosphorylase
MKTLGIIGGSGLYGISGLQVISEKLMETPYGTPSSPLVEAIYEDTRMVFVARHGTSHEHSPSQVNYRANICALKMAGVEQVVSISAVGSMREEIEPGDVVIVDQYIDRTRHRSSSFFEDGIVAHVSLADPVCPYLSEAVARSAQNAGATVHRGGTYLCMEGPQFSTRAESGLYRSWGVSVIGMTAMPEAKLAREAQLPYATVAFSTDYDCWHESEEAVSVEGVLAVLRQNADRAHKIIRALPASLPDASASPATRALEHAIISKPPYAPSVSERLSWLLGDVSTR